jgi:hypothetical protein
MPDNQTKLICLGLVLPTEGAPGTQDPEGSESPEPAAGGTVVTFDLLRPAIHAVTPSRRRRWWQRG